MNVMVAAETPSWVSIGCGVAIAVIALAFVFVLLADLATAVRIGGVPLMSTKLADLKPAARSAWVTAQVTALPIICAAYSASEKARMALVLIPLYWIGLFVWKLFRAG